jgi:hypothetical protein
MVKVTWGQNCIFCQRPITRGKPMLVLSIEGPKLIGFSHSSCGWTKTRFGLLQTCPPYYLSDENVSFLVQLFPRLYGLPGGMEQNGQLRGTVARMLRDYPESICDPILFIREFISEQHISPYNKPYVGDLETDFIRFLAETKRLAETRLGIEVDFRT